MTLQPIDNTTTTYRTINKSFYIDIVENNNRKYPAYEAYIYNEEYQVKMFMFAVQMKDTTRADFLEVVEKAIPEYMQDYYFNYMQE